MPPDTIKRLPCSHLVGLNSVQVQKHYKIYDSAQLNDSLQWKWNCYSVRDGSYYLF